MAAQRTRPAGGVDRNRRAKTFFASVVLDRDATHAFVFKQQVSSVRVLEYVYTGITCASQQALVHLGPAESQRAVRRSKPRAGDAGTLAGTRIENGFAQRSRTRGEHLICHT